MFKETTIRWCQNSLNPVERNDLVWSEYQRSKWTTRSDSFGNIDCSLLSCVATEKKRKSAPHWQMSLLDHVRLVKTWEGSDKSSWTDNTQRETQLTLRDAGLKAEGILQNTGGLTWRRSAWCALCGPLKVTGVVLRVDLHGRSCVRTPSCHDPCLLSLHHLSSTVLPLVPAHPWRCSFLSPSCASHIALP